MRKEKVYGVQSRTATWKLKFLFNFHQSRSLLVCFANATIGLGARQASIFNFIPFRFPEE